MSVHKNKDDFEEYEPDSAENQVSVEFVDTLIGSSDSILDTNVLVAETVPEKELESKRLVDPIEYRVQQITDKLALEGEPAWFLATVFNASFYQANSAEDLESLDAEALFADFLSNGLDADISPSPAIDIDYIRKYMQRQGLLSEPEQSPVLKQWLKYGLDTIPGHAWFDSQKYLEYYPDVAGTVSNAYAHFAIHGIYENRIPCEQIKAHIDIVYSSFSISTVDMELIFNSVPTGFSEQFLASETQQVLRNIFMPALYAAQIDADKNIADNTLYSHFLLFGADNHCRPTALFHDQYYQDSLASYEARFTDTDKLQEFSSLSNKYIDKCKTIGTCSLFFHWFFKGMSLGVVPTPLFNTDHYIYAHSDIKDNWNGHPFMHFIESGVREQSRAMSILFDSNYYTQRMQGLQYDNALLDYTLRGQFQNAKPVAGILLHHFEAAEPLQSSVLEEAAIYFAQKTDKLDTGVLCSMVKLATELEPQVVRPYGIRGIRYAPVFHPEVDIMQNMREIQPKIPREQYDTIILMPHCRMAGSAKIAGQFAKAMAGMTNIESILVITTDLSVFDRPDWFPEHVDIFDLSQYLGDMDHQRKVRILLDISRGLCPQRIININSNLGWHLTTNYGKQISSWTELYIYLFCWDRDEKGNKGGYPIQWFLPTFDYCTGVFTDSMALRDELQDRYCVTDAQQNKIVALHTPAENTNADYNETLSHRDKANGVRRIFWSGRFDNQKRLDILFAIAKRMPDIEFWVWGKAVMNDGGIDIDQAPNNIMHMGVYNSIDDVPIASCDCFLYTAGWDGLPTVLIEVGSRAIPIVASDVGGVGDLINTDTGYPIADYANPDEYCLAISHILNHYPEALEKARQCREHALNLCDEKKYISTINSMIFKEQSHNV